MTKVFFSLVSKISSGTSWAKIEIILPKSEQIYNDHFKRGDQIRGLIKDVDLKFGKSPEIIMSRTSNVFLQKLFIQGIFQNK